MSSRTMVVSTAIHIGVAAALLFAAERKQARKATSIAVVDEQKKKAEEKKKEPPKPPPPPPRREPKPVEHKASAEPPRPSTPAPEAKSAAPAPVDTGLTLGDSDGPGIDVGSKPGDKPSATRPEARNSEDSRGAAKKAAPAPKKKDETPGEAPCTEDATKPEALTDFDADAAKQAAQRANVEGRAKLRITIDANGAVSKVEVTKSLDPQLDAVLVAIAEKMRFKPATRCGKPVFGGVITLAPVIELTD